MSLSPDLEHVIQIQACVNPLLSPCFVIGMYVFWVAGGVSVGFFVFGFG